MRGYGHAQRNRGPGCAGAGRVAPEADRGCGLRPLRGRRGDCLKLLYFDGHGFCLYYKILQRDVSHGLRRPTGQPG
ncbi:IS66 family insertion sequence element accessory protein TnpB (plasmid) [Sinorhizobium kummerowiae]|nr:IS66 family insertion sequence element accessory protein TnpB [Sinorhizobium kummerowiae]